MAENSLTNTPRPIRAINDQGTSTPDRNGKTQNIRFPKLKPEHIRAMMASWATARWVHQTQITSTKGQRDYLRSVREHFRAQLITSAMFWRCGCIAAEMGGAAFRSSTANAVRASRNALSAMRR